MKLNLLPLILILLMTSCKNQTSSLYVGTYTNGDSQGIYKLDFNEKTGELSNKQLVAITDNPSYLSYSNDKTFIYSVNENKNGFISSFKIEDDNTLKLLNKVSSNGAHPCHIELNKKGDKIIVSNYTGGNASICLIKDDGTLTEAIQVLNHNTDSIASHVHSAQFYNNNLYVSDLGKNAIYNYKFENDRYKLIDSSIVNLTNNAGPRHFALTKDGNFIYIINEYAGTISSAKKNNDKFQLIEHQSTLSNDYKDYNASADIHLSKNEEFLYASNRGENSIAVFNRDLIKGTITNIQNISTQGDWPRNFIIDPTGKFLLVANERSNNISVFKINETNGTLSFLTSKEVSSPTCLLF